MVIIKNKKLLEAVSPTSKAGQKQELDVAFYLRRAFKDDKRIFVINDFSFTFNDENAQIDHLIVHPYGFVLIESKSIKGEVKVNKQGEWSRSFNKHWSGMPSPIQQVELQQRLLREFLFENREAILPNYLGLLQESFGGRTWHNLCAVSSSAVIERDDMPKDISKQICKSEFVVDTIKKIINLRNRVVSRLTFDSRPIFTDKDLGSIIAFLVENCSQEVPSNVIEPHTSETKAYSKAMVRELNTSNDDAKIAHESRKPSVEEQTEPRFQAHDSTPVAQSPSYSNIACKRCGEQSALVAKYGRYGYYVQCKTCEANTSMKLSCRKCSSKNTRVSKRQEVYSLSCSDCETTTRLI